MKSVNKKAVSVRFSAKTLQTLRRQAKRTGKTQTRLIEDAIENAYNLFKAVA